MKNLSDLGCFINYTLLLTLILYHQLRIIHSGLFYLDICIKINFEKNVQSQQVYFIRVNIALGASHLEGDLLLPPHIFNQSRFGDKGVIDAVKIETYRRR
ncbi:MAG: hypothetical protein V7K32_08030 [Nostoc sp.]|uniref:hypothetical protein n=1 Tax=Nostoc sp. TaxID=1180 RepID=UPI002FF72BDC